MKNILKTFFVLVMLLIFFNNANASISISPGDENAEYRNHLYVLKGSTRTFYASSSVNNAAPVNWSTTGGLLFDQKETTVQWTAPDDIGTYNIVATSTDLSEGSATATVTVVQPIQKAEIIPYGRVLYKGQTQVLQFIMYGDVDNSVIWSKSGGTFVGSGQSIGFYADTAGTYTITATSAVNNSISATSIIYVTDNEMPEVTNNHTQSVDCTAIKDIPGAPQNGTTYDVGKIGSPYQTLASIDWNNLHAGDTVRIWNNGNIYYEQFGITNDQRGTQSQPIRVCGVPDANGNLPIIDGTGATLRADVNFYSAGGRNAALFLIGQSSSSNSYSYNVNPPMHPGYLMIEGLNFKNANQTISYDTESYKSAACVSIHGADHIVLGGNEISACTNGVFAAASGDGEVPEGGSLRHMLIEGNYVHDAGMIDGYHNLYVESLGAVFQFNWVGLSAPGSSALKTRSYPGFVRYNYIWCNAQCLDINEPQNSAGYIYTGEWDSYHSTNDSNHSIADIAAQEEWLYKYYVYGNVFDNSKLRTARAGAGVHYSTDSNWNRPVPGTLYYYNNTLYEKADRGGDYSSYGDIFATLGRYASNLRTEWSSMEAYNNLIWREIITPGQELPYWQWNGWVPDRIKLGKNWINDWGSGIGVGFGTGFAEMTSEYAKYSDATDGNPWPGSEKWRMLLKISQGSQIQGFVTGTENIINGASTSSPIDNNMVPVINSPIINSGQSLPSYISELTPQFYMNPTTLIISRRIQPLTMGAIEGVSMPDTTSPSSPTGLSVI